jgi:hypothetical protein
MTMSMSAGISEVQEILDFRYTDGCPLYLVHWRGYDSPTDFTWEPIRSLKGASDLVRLFNAAHGIELPYLYNRLLGQRRRSKILPPPAPLPQPPSTPRFPVSEASIACYSEMLFSHLFPTVHVSESVRGPVTVIDVLDYNGKRLFKCRTPSGDAWIALDEMKRNHAIALIDWLEAHVGTATR